MRSLCYSILMSKEPEHPNSISPWVQAIQQRGLAPSALFLLENFAAFAPILAQALWVFQPIAGIFGQHQPIQGLAQSLETPEGLQALQAALIQDDDSVDMSDSTIGI